MRSTLLLLILAPMLYGGDLKVPETAKGQPSEFIRIPATTDCKNLIWFSPDPGLNVFPVDLLKDSKTAVVTANKPGRYRLYCVGASADTPTGPAMTTVLIGDPPAPTPGPGPGPDPQPKPPANLPFPGATGLHVLIVLERAEVSKLPSEQQSAIYGSATRDYLNSKCAGHPDGKTKAWRVWDKDDDGSADSKLFGDQLKASVERMNRIPWIAISNGRDGFEGPLPANPDELLQLLKKYGGE